MESAISVANKTMTYWMCIGYVKEQMVGNTPISTQSRHVATVIGKSMPGKFKFTGDISQQRGGTYCISQMKKEKKSGNKLDVIA